MFYIVTYATHSQSYFEILKQSCPELVVLGFGEKWTGFHDKVNSTLKFCESKQPDDLVCFVDGFDSVVLASKEEILEQYKSLEAPLVISKDTTTTWIGDQYFQDKVFGKCQSKVLNSGLYMGTAKSIIEFWKEMQIGDDDQTYATQKCNKIDYSKIDSECKLFYNYSSADKLVVKNNSLYVNDRRTCIISSPGNHSINPLLKQLNYKNLPDIQLDLKYRLSTYAKHFVHEIVVLAMIVGAFVYFKNAALSVFLSSVLVVALLQYEVGVKHMDIPIAQKLLYTTVHFAQALAAFYILYLGFKIEYKMK